MNRIYRTLWSVATQSWQAVPETAKSAGKKSNSSAGGVLATVALGIGLSGGANAQSPPAVNQLPTGGSVARGTATISQTATAQASAMTVNQSSQRAVINWNTFNVGSNASVNFVQPNAQAVTLNRVNDSNPSQIFGRISANGQVFLTNANGVYFSRTSSVDVGAFTATTHSITDDNFMSGKYVFERNGATGKIINEGNITAALGGYVALLAPEVQNAGVVVARAGTVAMAAGETITLNFDGVGGLAGITTTPSAIASLIENKLAVQAPEGQIILSAVALNKLQMGLIKNSGTLEANSLVNKGGKIYLEGDSITLESNSKIEAKGPLGGGTVLVGGDWQGSGTLRQATKVTMEAGATIDASATDNGDGGKVVLWSDVYNANSVTQVNGSIKSEAGPSGGNGGKVETSGHHLSVDNIQVSTQASKGVIGQWLLDPVDFTIAASGGNMTGTALTTSLSSTDVTILSSSGSTGTDGDINVNDVVSWGANKLTLNAYRNINVNAVMTATGTATLDLLFGQGASAAGNTSVIKMKMGLNNTWDGKINLLAGTGKFQTKKGSDGVAKTYTVITALGASNSTTLADLQGLKNATTANYVLGSDIDATATNTWNAGGGFVPIGKNTAFSGTFDGLGHSISNLYISTTSVGAGLFAKVTGGGLIQNVGLVNVDVRSTSYAVSGLVGYLTPTISTEVTINNSFVTGSVRSTRDGTETYVGGILGFGQGPAFKIIGSYSTANIDSLGGKIGGLVGGLADYGSGSEISNSYATGNVTAHSATNSNNVSLGGLVGWIFGTNTGTLNFYDNYSTSNVTGYNFAGGLIGNIQTNFHGNISRNYASGLVTSSATVMPSSAGLIGALATTNFLTSSNNYWNKETTGKTVSFAGVGTFNANELTTAQTLDESNFVGFSMTGDRAVWGVDSSTGPYLCGLGTYCGPMLINSLPVPSQSSTYGTEPSLHYCYSSTASSCTPVSGVSFSTTQLDVFSWQQIAALSPSQFSALSPAQLASLSVAQLQAVSAAQMSFMTPAQLGGLTPSQFAGLNNAQLQAMSGAQVRDISTAQLSLLSPAQIALLTGNAATPLSLQQIMALTPAQLGGMSTVQVARLTAAEVGSLSDAQLHALSLEQLAAISPASLAALSSEQIMALSLMQVASLTPDQLSSLSPTQIASLSAEEIASFDAQQLAAIGIFPTMDESDAETVVTAQFTAPAPVAQGVSQPTTPSLEVTTVATETSCTNAASANSIQKGVLSISVLSNTSANIQTTGVSP